MFESVRAAAVKPNDVLEQIEGRSHLRDGPASLKIVLITKADLPEGQGHTTRLRSIARVLTTMGHQVCIWNQHSLGVVPSSEQRVEGQLEGANYRYVLGTTERGLGFQSFRTKYRAVRTISRLIRSALCNGGIDILWFNQLSFYDTYPLTKLARRHGISTIQAYEDERYGSKSFSLASYVFGLDSWASDRVCPRLADSIVVISSYLQEKYGNLAHSTDKVHLLPTIVDCEAWRCPPEEDRAIPMIFYAGSFGAQDEVELLIEALAILKSNGAAFRVVMLGANLRDSRRMAGINKLIQKYGLSSMIEIKGFVPSYTVQEYIREANILISVRRDQLCTRAGFSTKLTEYLASGRMVITSKVGDVDRYLTDGESALLLSPSAAAAEIAASIARGLSSFELRRRIGARGHEAARRFFDYSVAKARVEKLLSKTLQR